MASATAGQLGAPGTAGTPVVTNADQYPIICADNRRWAALSAGEKADVVDGYRLVYHADSVVNWCPGLGTVLANEEVTAEGRSDIGNYPVFKRNMRQWVMRITAYSDRLLADLDLLDWPEPIKVMQRNWIGRSTGAQVRFASDAGDIEVFTTRPDTLFGATFAVLAPEHPLVDAVVPDAWPADTPDRWKLASQTEVSSGAAAPSTPAEAVASYRTAASAKSDRERQEDRQKSGVFTGATATNPVTGTTACRSPPSNSQQPSGSRPERSNRLWTPALGRRLSLARAPTSARPTHTST